MNSDSF